MTNSNYIRHFKNLGKLCYLYDQASANITAMQTLVSASYDQWADGTLVSYPVILLLNPYSDQLKSAITNGASALKSVAVTMAGQYLLNADFLKDFEHSTPTATSVKAVLEALITEMQAVAPGDNKALTTQSATGFVNFFETNWAPAGSFLQAAPGDYPDATYVVAAVI